MRNWIVIVLLVLSVKAFGQSGKIRGTVLDNETGETLVGVTILVEGTTNGTITDLDGMFSLDRPSGNYNLQVSYISYQTISIEDVEVNSGEVTALPDIRMLSSTVDLEEVTITAEAIRTTESALQTVRRKSAVLLDGISARKMQLTGDATAVEAAKRITGVSVEGGKYIFVRGLGDRYTKTTLNGMEIPGLDPDRNSLQMDIFPIGLINNIMVSKNFTADLPADFTGGIVNVETKDFPVSKIFNVSISTSFNPDMHLNPDFLSYSGGKTDFLGFDDGSRALPDKAGFKVIPSPISRHSTDEANRFINSFNPELGATSSNSLFDLSASFSVGDQLDLKSNREGKEPKLGYIFSVSYKTDYKFYDNVLYGEYQRIKDQDVNELLYATRQEGSLGERNVLVGLLGGIAYKTAYSKIRLTAMRLQNGENRAGKFFIDDNSEAAGKSGYTAFSDNLEYNQRSLTNIFLGGDHLLKNSGWEIDWGLSPTYSTSHDPDIRKTAFTETVNGLQFSAGAGGNPSRIWRDLQELNIHGKVDVTKEYDFNGSEAKLKFGISHSYKTRRYEILLFDMQFFGGTMIWPEADANAVLHTDNIYPSSPNIYYASGNSVPNPNQYSSNVNNTGLYVSNEFNITRKLKSTLGLRAENYVQRHTGRDQTFASGDEENGRNLDNEKVLESLDLFPSAILIYGLTGKQNLRFSYTRTIARPSFKELSFAQILDPISNTWFNGALFKYPGSWDGDLKETRVNNLDMRWEYFLSRGQIFSVSGFYKQFDNPIELVRIPEQQTTREYQPRNVGKGSLYGVELEIMKNLDFLSGFLSNFGLNGNFTYVKSRIEMTEREFNSRKSYEKTGEIIKKTRDMAGQAPYVINAGITYSDFNIGVDAGLFYNVKGPTLTVVGVGLVPDVYVVPFESLNFSLNKKLGEDQNTMLEFKVSNILGSYLEEVYRSYEAEDQPNYRIYPGRSFGIGLKHKF